MSANKSARRPTKTTLRDVLVAVLALLFIRPSRHGAGREDTAPADTGPDPATERAMLGASTQQARATWAGAAMALVAVLLSWLAWSGQQKINAYLLQRAPRVYAARVAVWAIAGKEVSSVLLPGLDVSVQNRAPVPLGAVTISASLDSAGTPQPVGSIAIGDVPPCTLLKFRLSPPRQHRFRAEHDNWLSYAGLTLVFSETDRHWRLEPGRLVLNPDASAAPAAALPLLIPRPPESESLSDCSESG